ncbi:hypothetical protein [Nocardia cyriacigeorgica]|uniref:hypothetical protein n=1 Tax=Nocardia cyriacigeorgica TaxID=135487 RepID=UPI0024575FFD|nr:hypothetical protein [Nocardia cyriacigeorgica]
MSESAVFSLLGLLGIIGHVCYYTARDGIGHLTSTFAPALGVRIPYPFNTICHIAAPALAFGLVTVGSRPALFGAVALFSSWLLCQPYRISNHLIFTWMCLVALAFAGSDQDVAMRWLLAVLYLSAAAIKLNREFLTTEASAAIFMLSRYCERMGFGVPHQMARCAPWAAVAAEASIGLLLLTPCPLLVTYTLAAVLHLGFGILGNFHFSLLVLAPWSLALSVAPGTDTAVQVAVFFGAIIGVVCGRFLTSPEVFPERGIGILTNTGLATAYCAISAFIFTTADPANSSMVSWSAVTPIILGVINIVLLISGIKSEWSFAMFSNTRPFWSERVIGVRIAWRESYFHVIVPQAVTESVRAPAHIRAKIADRSAVFSSAMAAELQRLAPDEVVVRAARLDRERMLFVPADSADAHQPSPGVFRHPPVLPRDLHLPYYG